MIHSLKKKIFLIICIPLNLLFIVTISMFLYTTSNNMINMTTKMYDHFMPIEQTQEIREHKDKRYIYTINNNQVVPSPFNSGEEEVLKLAQKAYDQWFDSGYISKYIYHVNQTKHGKEIVLIENEQIVSQLKQYRIISAISVGVFMLLSIYLAKLITQRIVKPVEDTIDSQRTFISDASHELKTPLAVINANVDVLETKYGNNKWIGYIQSEIMSMNKLINDLLTLSKLESLIETPETINLSKSIRMQCMAFESMAYEKNIQFDYDIDENVECLFNEDDLKRIVGVLIDNGLSHASSYLKVSLKIDHHIVLKITNDGDTIPIQQQDKIFERFYRIDKSRNRNEKRYGLGLSIAKSACIKNNATISVSSKEGITSFIVTI